MCSLMGTQQYSIGKKSACLIFLLVFLVAQLKIFLASAVFPADLWGFTETLLPQQHLGPEVKLF